MNQWVIILLIFTVLSSKNVFSCEEKSAFDQYCAVYEKLMLDDSMVSIGDPKKKGKKEEKRKEFKEVRVTEQAKFFNGALGKIHRVNLPKSEVPFEFHRISELKKGIARANYLAVLKAKKDDKKKGQARPLSQYEPHLQSIDLTINVEGNVGTDQFGILVVYDDHNSSNVSNSSKKNKRKLPELEEIEIGDKVYLVDFFGNLEESKDLETALEVLKSKSTKYYTIHLKKKNESLPAKAPGMRTEKIQGWSMSQDLGRIKIKIPHGHLATGISFWGKSKITSAESLIDKNVGKNYLKGTPINYVIEDLTYTVNVRGLQKLDKKNKRDTYIDHDKEKSSCYEHVEPRMRESYIAFSPFPNTPYGVDPLNSDKEKLILKEIDILSKKRKDVIASLENEIIYIQNLEKNFKATTSDLEDVIKLQEKLRFMPDFNDDSYKGTALVLDVSGSMSGKPAQALKNTTIEALNKLPEGKEFAIFYQQSKKVQKVSFDPNLSWEENKKNMIEFITNFRIGGGDSEILKPLLDVNNHKLNPEMKNISHVYAITDGYLWEYDEFQNALGTLKGTTKEFNVLQVGANYESKISEDLQMKARDVKELDNKIFKKKKAVSRLILAQKVLDQRNPVKKMTPGKTIAAVDNKSEQKEKVKSTTGQTTQKDNIQKKKTPEIKKIKIEVDGRFHEDMRVIKDPETGKDKIEVQTTKGLKVITPGELEKMIKSFQKELKTISAEKPKLINKYDAEFAQVQGKRKGDEELLNLLADMTGGERVPIGDLGNLEEKRRKAEADERKYKKNIQNIKTQLQERKLENFDPQYVTTLQEELKQARIDLTNQKGAADLKGSRNSNIDKQIKKVQEIEAVIGNMVNGWEEEVTKSKNKREVKRYIKRVYVDKYKSYKKMVKKD